MGSVGLPATTRWGVGKGKADVLVIGGGVIGICVAYYLADLGASVSVIDKGEICTGCSYGNAGLLVPSLSLPLSSPAALTKALKWMFDADSPFYIRPRFDLELASWLWRFVRASNYKQVKAGARVLKDLSTASLELYQQLAHVSNLKFGYQQKGVMVVYRDREALQQGIEEAKLLRDLGIESQILTDSEAVQLEPALSSKVCGAVYFPEDAHLNPDEFVRALAHEAERKGVRIMPQTEVWGSEITKGRISVVQTTRGDFKSEFVVLAAGAWSANLARDFGTAIAVQPAKGYSVSLTQPRIPPEIPLLLGETKVAITPMGETLRFAGTLEVSGLDLSLKRRRVDGIMRSVCGYLQVTEGCEVREIWRGLRAVTPDGLPIIGPSNNLRNLIIATGHAMLGMTLGPITGTLVRDMVAGRNSCMDVSALRVGRFS
jgi:D-amino-acid dehydrogenase